MQRKNTNPCLVNMVGAMCNYIPGAGRAVICYSPTGPGREGYFINIILRTNDDSPAFIR